MGPERGAAAGAGGGASAAEAGGGKNAGVGDRSSIGSIIYIYKYIYIFVVTSAGRESQCQVDNNGENNQADDANRRALCIDSDHHERSRGEDDNGSDDGSLSDWLGFYFEGEFHERSQRRRGRW